MNHNYITLRMIFIPLAIKILQVNVAVLGKPCHYLACGVNKEFRNAAAIVSAPLMIPTAARRRQITSGNFIHANARPRKGEGHLVFMAWAVA